MIQWLIHQRTSLVEHISIHALPTASYEEFPTTTTIGLLVFLWLMNCFNSRQQQKYPQLAHVGKHWRESSEKSISVLY